MLIIRHTVDDEREMHNHTPPGRFVWMDFGTASRARRSLVDSNIMFSSGSSLV